MPSRAHAEPVCCHTSCKMLPASRAGGERGQGTALEPSQGMASPLNSRYFGADHHVRRGGRGAQWSGDACVALASPMGDRWEAAGEQDAGRPKGPHPSSLPPPPLRDEPASLLVSHEDWQTSGSYEKEAAEKCKVHRHNRCVVARMTGNLPGQGMRES